MTEARRKPPANRLNVRIPFVFEAEGEGATPVLLVAVLAVLVLGAFCYLVYPFG